MAALHLPEDRGWDRQVERRRRGAVNSICELAESRGALPLAGSFALEPRLTQDPVDNPVHLHLH